MASKRASYKQPEYKNYNPIVRAPEGQFLVDAQEIKHLMV